ncbi:f-box family protein, partial [Genlisea aurea]
MEERCEYDLISELPQSVAEIILTKLPILEAVRTSVLSRRWRYRWSSLTDIVFDDRSVIKSRIDRTNDFITKLLFAHNGPVHKFSISTSHLKIGPEIDQWLLFVSRKDIRDLVIELRKGSWITMPSCVFSCSKLTRLELSYCQFDIPPNFSGFPFLKYLKLKYFYTDTDDLDNLISSSPCLE